MSKVKAEATASSSPLPTSNNESIIIVPTEEQENIYAQIRPPNDTTNKEQQPYIVRITAGAGAGKTTTILNLAAKAVNLNHKYISYLTFSKAAVADGERRIIQTLQGLNNETNNNVTVDSRTLHSCAMKLLSERRKEEKQYDETKIESKLFNDQRLELYIEENFKNEIGSFLSVALENIKNNPRFQEKEKMSRIDRAYTLVLFYIRKTLDQFCRSAMSLEQLQDSSFRQRNYYPATKFHSDTVKETNESNGENYGFPTQCYKMKVGTYADLAYKVWQQLVEDNARTYNTEMKQAQLLKLRIPGTIILCDECQDMDECQMNWIKSQAKSYNTHVYFVGDAAQTIYSFRGAKSKYMMNIKDAVDCTLTKSFRFGQKISNIANLVLFAKEKSPQTTANYNPVWRPYRVVGGGDDEGTVTADPILSKWKEKQITLISFSNATLMSTAVELFGMDMSTIAKNGDESEVEDDEEQERTDAGFSSEDDNNATFVSEGHGTKSKKLEGFNVLDALTFPKIHINGKGENSGMKKWKYTLKQIETIFNIFKSGDDGTAVPLKEFGGRHLVWKSFIDEVESRELNQFVSSISIVLKFQEKTMEAMELFKCEVIDKNYKAEEADIILSTCHAAKGMEWDHVQVCEDFMNLSKVHLSAKCSVPDKSNFNKKRQAWEFDMKSWGDEVNLLYVACTRAKKILSIPSCIKHILQECDLLHEMMRMKKIYKQKDMSKDCGLMLFGRKEVLTVEQAINIYSDIVLPLRNEYMLDTKDRLMKVLLEKCNNDMDKESLVDEAIDGDNEFEAFFGISKNAVVSASEPLKATSRVASSVEAAAIESVTSHTTQSHSSQSYTSCTPSQYIQPTTLGISPSAFAPSQPYLPNVPPYAAYSGTANAATPHLPYAQPYTAYQSGAHLAPPPNLPYSISHSSSQSGTVFAPPTDSHPKVSPEKKEKMAFKVIREANEAYANAPPGTHRLLDLKEKAVTGKAKCRECNELIKQGNVRIGVQVYQVGKSKQLGKPEFWPYYFHSKCFPKKALQSIRIDPNPAQTKKRSNAIFSSGYRKGGSTWGSSSWGNKRRRW